MNMNYDYEGGALRKKIERACADVSNRLTRLADQEIHVHIATDNDLKKIEKDWLGKSFSWGGHPFRDHSSVCSFRLVVKSDDVICGAVKNSLEKEDGYKGVVIERIEGNPDDLHPLKGFIVDIFCEAALEIAKTFDMPKIEGEEPIDALIPIYKSLGFFASKSGRKNKILLSVSDNTRLNPRVFDM